MDKQEILLKLRKFTQDPDFHLLEEMLMGHLEPLRDINSVDSSLTNDQIASEVRGRQLTIKSLEGFLKDVGIINSKIDNKTTTFK